MATSTGDIETLFQAGAHFGCTRARRHPTASPFIFGTKDRSDIFDLEKTGARLETAKAFLSLLASTGRSVVFVGGKNEAAAMVTSAAERLGQPYVAGRWIGGTLTNFKNIRKRIDRLEKLIKQRETGELEKYTKKERLLIDREIEELLGRFGGLVNLQELPAALVVVDTRHEDTAVREANQLGIPVIGIANSDCDFSLIQYAIPANDGVIRSIGFFLDALADAFQAGRSSAVAKASRGSTAPSA